MAQEFDRNKLLDIPRHDEPEASDKLQQVLVRLVERLSVPEPEPSEIPGCQEAISHPDTDAVVLAVQTNGRERGVSESPLRVSVFPQDSIHRRRRTYVFRSDGTVSIEAKRDRRHELSPGPDSITQETVEGWPEGVRHLLRYVVGVLRDSARWETELAENLEIQAAIDGSSGYERGRRDGAAGLDPKENSLGYLMGHVEGRDYYILKNPANR